MWLIARICLISGSIFMISWIFFHHGRWNRKTTRGAAPDPSKFFMPPSSGSVRAPPPRKGGLGASLALPRSGAAHDDSRCAAAGKTSFGPALHPVCFLFLPPMVKKNQDTQLQSPRYSGKATLLSQKQRRYTYYSHVYAISNLPLLQSSTSWYIHIL